MEMRDQPLTFHEEPVDIGPLPRWMAKVVFCLFGYVHSQSHFVQGPLILACDALQHSCKDLHVNTPVVGEHIIIVCHVESGSSPVRKD